MLLDKEPDPLYILRDGMQIYNHLPCKSCIIDVHDRIKPVNIPAHANCLQMVSVRVPGILNPIFISACRECDGLVDD